MSTDYILWNYIVNYIWDLPMLICWTFVYYPWTLVHECVNFYACTLLVSVCLHINLCSLLYIKSNLNSPSMEPLFLLVMALVLMFSGWVMFTILGWEFSGLLLVCAKNWLTLLCIVLNSIVVGYINQSGLCCYKRQLYIYYSLWLWKEMIIINYLSLIDVFLLTHTFFKMGCTCLGCLCSSCFVWHLMMPLFIDDNIISM